MNHVMSKDGPISPAPVYICVAESQLNSVMNSLESARGDVERERWRQ
jgi:hypothetical protein